MGNMNNIMQRFQLLFLIGLMPGLGASLASAAPKEVKPLQQWKGNLANRELMKVAANLLTSQAQFEKLWKAWRPDEKLPAVDFTKEIALVDTTVGSVLNFRATLDDNGNLRTMAMATKDLRPGFRYVISTVSREGIKTVNGKELAPAAPQTTQPKPQLPKPGNVSWDELKLVLQHGAVKMVGQTHARQVSVVLEDNQTYRATEPAIDDVIKFLREIGKTVPIATE
jgi:hypothetical protein